MRKLVFLIVALVALGAPAMAFAAGAVAEHHTDGTFSASQDYAAGVGPACYYGGPVHVVYESTNRWTWILKGNDVRENLEQSGKAYVYMAGALIDTRPFHVIEDFDDVGGDASVALVSPGGTWYSVHAGAGWDSPKLERYHYIWQINGVYQFELWNRSGNVSGSWRSGSCEGAYVPGSNFPPHPPHP